MLTNVHSLFTLFSLFKNGFYKRINLLSSEKSFASPFKSSSYLIIYWYVKTFITYVDHDADDDNNDVRGNLNVYFYLYTCKWLRGSKRFFKRETKSVIGSLEESLYTNWILDVHGETLLLYFFGQRKSFFLPMRLFIFFIQILLLSIKITVVSQSRKHDLW